MRILSVAALYLFFIQSAFADDGAASIAAGGLVFRREPNIVMAKEVLTISQSKVIVDYEFRNDSNADITTEVAFPVPPYHFGEDELSPKDHGFDDFQLSVNGLRTPFRTEVRAMVGERDVTAVLTKYRIDIAGFSGASEGYEPDFSRLTDAQLSKLLRMKAIIRVGTNFFNPTWTVVKKYYWLQTFKAHAVTAVHHQYKPVVGGNQIPSEYIRPEKVFRTEAAIQRELQKVLATVCLAPLEKARLAKKDTLQWFSWVDFILTTANTWKQPIEDFTLNVERGAAKNEVSFCWDGTVEKTGNDRFTAHATNFVPRRELRIGYYQPMKF